MKKTIYCPDIECESCFKVLSRVFKNIQGIQSYNINPDSIYLEYDEALLKPEALLAMIHEKGYRAAFTPFTRKSLKERTRDFIENKRKYEVEYIMLKHAGLSLLFLLVLEVLLYFSYFKNISGFFFQYGIWIFYLTLSVVALNTAIWHFKSYKTEITCMVGMMIGMTIGMQSGLLIGAILGATNGMFVGALVGMLVGVTVGWYNGQCCGIMGIMEGMMAGLMGGTMGAMLTVMLLSNNILWFMPPYIIINILILAGFSYMLFEEVVENSPAIEKAPIDFWTFFSSCFLATLILAIIIVSGPKTGIYWAG